MEKQIISNTEHTQRRDNLPLGSLHKFDFLYGVVIGGVARWAVHTGRSLVIAATASRAPEAHR